MTDARQTQRLTRAPLHTAVAVLCLLAIRPASAAASMPGMGFEPLPHTGRTAPSTLTRLSGSLPTSLDLREEGIITPSKHQEGCGSCWAFAAISCMEAICIRNGADPSLDLSEQYLISCDTEEWVLDCGTTENNGCCGGNASTFEFLRFYGAAREDVFPYGAGDSEGCCTALTVPCPDPEPESSGWRVSEWGWVDGGAAPSVETLKNALMAYGPIWVGFILYEDFVDRQGGGYWYDGDPEIPYVHTSGTRVGAHAVALIGYDDSPGCWIAKNSWGEFAGPSVDGTFRVAYDNNCCFGLNAAWITVEEFGTSSPIAPTSWGAIKAVFMTDP